MVWDVSSTCWVPKFSLKKKKSTTKEVRAGAIMHEAVVAYFKGSECGFESHICCLRRYPDYKHRLCPLCVSINSRWPPPPKDPPPPEKNPDLIYPGDIDPEFRPTRGDILVVNPAIGPGLRKLGFRGNCVVSFDGSPEFQFVRGDVLVRIGAYEVTVVEPPARVEEKKGKKKAPPAKARGEKNNEESGHKGGAIKEAAKGSVFEAERASETEKPVDLVTYKPYERLEVYYYTGDDQWKFMGTQQNLEVQNKVLLQTQCPGLTAFYRYYKAGTKLLPHTLAPCLGEIVLPEWIWQEDFDHKANKWRSAGRWYRPDIPDRKRLRPGMILLRPLVDQLKAEGSTLLNIVEMERAKKLEEAKAKELADKALLDKFMAMEAKTKADADAAAAASDEKDDKKKKGKKEDKKTKDGMKKKKDGKEDEKDDTKKKDEKDGKKDDRKTEMKKGGKKGARGEEKVEETPPEAPIPPTNTEFLKLAKWGSVELYRLETEEEDAQTWTYYGRSNRICDTAYSLPSETTKLKFVHEDDRAQILQVPPEEPPPEPEPNKKDSKGKKGKVEATEEKVKKEGGGDKDKKKTKS